MRRSAAARRSQSSTRSVTNHFVACHNWQLVRADAEAKLTKRAEALEESAAATSSQPQAKEIV